ncbi:MAG: FAD-binding protein [Rhizobiales bacterium]|nr:FAD-binding protein [Hyphomicrobiales bacterium]
MGIFSKLQDKIKSAIPRSVIRDLSEILKPDQIVLDQAGLQAFETDALTAIQVLPFVVVMPESTEDVAAIAKISHKYDVPMVPRGAGTSLAGGAIPLSNAIVVCLSRMNRILEIDLMNRSAKVQAGVTNLAISAAVDRDGFFYAPDPSSQLSCTIAGNVAMNSGGAHCLKYGVTTHNILGVKLVTAEGQILEFGGSFLDPAGYDFLSLIVGSEGGLGIVTEATVLLRAKPEGARPLLLGFETHEQAGDCVAAIIGKGYLPVAIEFMDKPAIKACEEHAHAGYPLDVEALLIIEFEGSNDEIDASFQQILRIASEFNPVHKRIASTEEEAAAIWLGRKSAFGAIGRISEYLCMDGVIPLSKLSHVLSKITEICDTYKFKVSNIFHAGDGNLHPLILYDANRTGEFQRVEKCGAEILELCVLAGGCITGEHGVGLEKRDLMTLQFDETDLVNQMRVKLLFDPNWVLNPDKVFPLELAETFRRDESSSSDGVSA